MDDAVEAHASNIIYNLNKNSDVFNFMKKTQMDYLTYSC